MSETKKIALVALVFAGYVLCTMPECFIAAGVTTKSLGYGCFTILALVLGVWFLYVMQITCHEAVQAMREQQRKELAERNIEIVVPTLQGVLYILKQGVVVAAELVVFIALVMLLLPLVWDYVIYPCRYILFGICFVAFGIMALCSAFMPKVEVDDNAN